MDKKTGNNQNTNHKGEEKKEIIQPKVWLESEVNLLKKWAELASSYRVLHDRAHRSYKFYNYLATIPVIIFSTILGTASFSQTTFPVQYQPYIPMGIGSLNIISGIITTVAQFTRVSELSESNRGASIAYGKFSRNIATELSLPPDLRTYSGIDFVQICRSEFDRLIEQSPVIPAGILNKFMKEIENEDITKPDVMKVTKIEEYKPTREEKAAKIIANAFQTMHNRTKDQQKTGVSKFADMIQKKGMSAINRINQIPTPMALKEIQSKFQSKPHTHDMQTSTTNLYKTGISKRKDEYDEIENDVESQIDRIGEKAHTFVERQKEERTQELSQIQSTGKVQNLIRQASGRFSGIVQSVTNTPKTVASVDSNVSNVVNETKKNVKSNVMNIIHKAKNTLETEVQEVGHRIERDIEMAQIETETLEETKDERKEDD